MNNLSNKKNLLLDLDGTVYQDLESVFGQVSKLMTKYISEKLNIDLKRAKELQTNYFCNCCFCNFLSIQSYPSK